jgi:hypothetical protein
MGKGGGEVWAPGMKVFGDDKEIYLKCITFLFRI